MSIKDSVPELSETRLSKLNSNKRLMKRLLFVLDFRLDETLRDVMLVSFVLILVSFYFGFQFFTRLAAVLVQRVSDFFFAPNSTLAKEH